MAPPRRTKQFRERDLRENLAALHRSIEAGTDVRGFFYWSLLDNFEWQFGYTKKFGLLSVDFADPKLPRAMKPLAEIYSKICRENAVGELGDKSGLSSAGSTLPLGFPNGGHFLDRFHGDAFGTINPIAEFLASAGEVRREQAREVEFGVVDARVRLSQHQGR
jgi:hypothetical protein